MKTDKEINEIIKQGLEEYAKAETKSENIEDVTFSKEHEEKMKNMFDNMRKESKSKKPADRELVIHIKFNWFTKVAVAVIVVGVFVSAVSTGIKAWRESKLNSYEGSGDYSWLLPNDTSEVYEKKTDEEKSEYVRSIFPGLSGEIKDVEITNNNKIVRFIFTHNNNKISLKIRNSVNIGMNSETNDNQIMYVEDTKIYYCEYDGGISFKWNKENFYCDMYGDFLLEEGKNIIKTMKYEKIETNF